MLEKHIYQKKSKIFDSSKNVINRFDYAKEPLQ